jgi:hypothetical protein
MAGVRALSPDVHQVKLIRASGGPVHLLADDLKVALTAETSEGELVESPNQYWSLCSLLPALTVHLKRTFAQLPDEPRDVPTVKHKNA